MKPDLIKAALVLGGLLIVAGLLAGGRYTITQQGGLAYVVDRFTGAVRVCDHEKCSDLPNNPSDTSPSVAPESAPKLPFQKDPPKFVPDR